MNENVESRGDESLGYPRCARCDKPVDEFKLTPDQRRSETIVVEFRCHGEGVRQEMPASVVQSAANSTKGLAHYTAFNDFTSGLLPPHDATDD